MVSYAGVILTMERDGTVISQPSAMPETDAVYVTGLNVTAWQPGEVVSAPASQLEALVTTLGALYDNAATGYVSELNVSNPHALYLYSRTGMRVDLGDSADIGRQGAVDGQRAAGSGGTRRDLGAAGRFPAATRPTTAPADGDLLRPAAASPRSCDGFAPIF